MDSPHRPATSTLRFVQALLGRTPRRDFFSLVALLDRVRPAGSAPIGGVGPLRDEFIRFTHDPAMAFRTTGVSDLEVQDDPKNRGLERAVLTTSFLGLTGIVTPMPSYIAEEISLEDSERPIRRQFLDIFHHRLLSLLYRLVTRYRYHQVFRFDLRDPWSRRVLALTGLDVYEVPLEQHDDQLREVQRLRLAPLFAGSAKTPHGLECMLEDLLRPELEGARICVQEFIRQWVELSPDSLTRLGSQRSALGESFLLGKRIRDAGGKFRLRIGDLVRKNFRLFLPGGRVMKVLKSTTQAVAGAHFVFDVELILGPGETPPMRLSSNPEKAARPGLDAWLTGRNERRTSVIFSP